MGSSSSRIAAVGRRGAPSARFELRVDGRVVPLQEGETIVGRGEGVHLVVADSLVSRRHTRFTLAEGALHVEDLGSVNGTFVNHARLHGRARVFAGDVVFVGGVELVVAEHVRAEEELTSSTRTERPAPGAMDSERRAISADSDLGRSPETTRASEMTTHVRMAERMLALGRVDAAVQILRSHIELVVTETRGGHAVDSAVIDTSGRASLRLALETGDERWVESALELHLYACRPVRPEGLRLLEALRVRGVLRPSVAAVRLRMRLRDRLPALDAAERLLVDELLALLPD